MLDRDGYRPNVAIVVVELEESGLLGQADPRALVAVSARRINPGETPEQAMYRELKEEVGLEPEHVKILGRTRDWLRYEVPQHWIKREWRGSYRGQKQIWYLLRADRPRQRRESARQRASRVRRLALARLLDSAGERRSSSSATSTAAG